MSNILSQIGDRTAMTGSKDDSLSNTLSSMLLGSPSSNGNEVSEVKNTFGTDDIHRMFNPTAGQYVSFNV